MSSNAMQLFQLIVNSMWTLFTSWKLPGLGFTPAQFVAFLLVFPLVLDFVSQILAGASSSFVTHENIRRSVDKTDYKSKYRSSKGG